MLRRSAIVLLLVPCLSWACASAEDRQLAALRDDLDAVQADNDKFAKRLDALEIKQDDDETAKKPVTTVARPVKTADGAEQAQVQTSEAAGAVVDDPDDRSPRPVIKVVGGGRRGQDVVQETLPDETLAGPPIKENAVRPSALDPEAKRAYDSALALVNNKQYSAGRDAFAAFLVRYPDHPYADNATYWRGECYFAEGDYVRAVEQFEGVIVRFPLGNKVPDAWLKSGVAYQKLGNPQKAKAAFDKLLRDWPKSDAARRVPRTENP